VEEAKHRWKIAKFIGMMLNIGGIYYYMYMHEGKVNICGSLKKPTENCKTSMKTTVCG
jgi:hypothetical protein